MHAPSRRHWASQVGRHARGKHAYMRAVRKRCERERQPLVRVPHTFEVGHRWHSHSQWVSGRVSSLLCSAPIAPTLVLAVALTRLVTLGPVPSPATVQPGTQLQPIDTVPPSVPSFKFVVGAKSRPLSLHRTLCSYSVVPSAPCTLDEHCVCAAGVRVSVCMFVIALATDSSVCGCAVQCALLCALCTPQPDYLTPSTGENVRYGLDTASQSLLRKRWFEPTVPSTSDTQANYLLPST